MPIRRALAAPFVVLLAALSSFACDDGDPTSIGPSRVTGNERFVSGSINLTPIETTIVAVPSTFCPNFSPFFAPVTLEIRAGGSSDLRFDRLQMQFTDSFGVRGPFTEINGVQLSGMFGSTVIPAFGFRTFPVSFPFGCVAGQTGTLFFSATASDSAGRTVVSSAKVTVG